MIPIVFSLALLNLALGYALAILLEPSRSSAAAVVSQAAARNEVPEASAAADAAEALAPAGRDGSAMEDVEDSGHDDSEAEPPAGDLSTPATRAEVAAADAAETEHELDEATIQAGCLMESSLQLAKSEIQLCRDTIVGLDSEFRADFAHIDGPTAKHFQSRFQESLERLKKKQQDVVMELAEKHEELAGLKHIADKLNALIERDLQFLGTTSSQIAAIPFANDLPDDLETLGQIFNSTVDQIHTCKEHVENVLSMCLWEAGRVGNIKKAEQFDPATELHNRLGLDAIFKQWQDDDPKRRRLLSIAYLDVDGFSTINQELGASVGDRILDAIANRMKQLVRKERGYDVMTRFTSQSFVAFFGDTGPRNAATAAERLRQNLEATVFQLEEHHLEWNVSCGVAEVKKADKTWEVIERAKKLSRAAKESGGNCTFIDEGGPTRVDPPEMKVESFRVRIRDK